MVVRNSPILANKEDANFREALKLYDAKQYKKALKLIETNLKKNSNHAESLALKGCLNYNLGHKSEAEPYILKAVGKEPNNYLVDHLAGIYYRNVENYFEAAKWFKATVDNGSPNKQILRDLSFMQAQTRDYKNLKDSRQAYLESQPGYRANWTAVAVAHHLNGDYNSAVATLVKIEDIIKDHLTDADRYEQSECALYKNSIISEAGNYQKALDHLEKDDDQIKDRLSVLEYKAKYYMYLGKTKEASLIYRELLKRNPDNVDYYNLLEISLGTTSKSVDFRLKLYEKLSKFYPRSDPPKLLPLAFLPSTNEKFEVKAEQYIVDQLKRGVPSTFVNVKPLYKNKKKLAIIEKIVLDFHDNKAPKEIPTVILWTKYFLAQHFLYKNQLDLATKYIDEALEHSPTLVELYIVKARVVKHQGDLFRASEFMEEGRKLDLQDRFINSKSTKYLLRSNQVNKAIETISLFTKLDEDSPNGCKDLHLMQVNWVLIESAEAYTRLYKEYEVELKNLTKPDTVTEEFQAIEADLIENIEIYKGLALKRFHSIIKNFKTFYDDQFDFHSYCMRRGTPRDYIQTLKWEDKIHSTPIYVRAIKGLSGIYWDIYNQQQLQKELDASTAQNGTAGAAKAKKNNKNKKKKAKASNVKKKAELISKVESEKDDADPLGAKLLGDLVNNSNGQILELLLVYVKQLTTEADKYAITWELAFDLYKNRGKYVLASQSLKNLSKILDPKGDLKPKSIATRVIDLLNTSNNDKNNIPAIAKVVEKSLEASFPDLSKGEEEFLALYH